MLQRMGYDRMGAKPPGGRNHPPDLILNASQIQPARLEGLRVSVEVYLKTRGLVNKLDVTAKIHDLRSSWLESVEIE